MGGQSNAFGAVPVTRDEQRLFFPTRGLLFPYICVSSRACLVKPAFPAFSDGDLLEGRRHHARTVVTDAPTAPACERHKTAAQHRRKVGVKASSAAASAQISAAAGMVTYPGPK